MLQKLRHSDILKLRVKGARRRGRGGRARRDRGQDGAPDRGAEGALRGEGEPPEARRRAAPRRHQAGQGLRGHEAQAVRGRQDGRPPRQQGRHRAHPARGGHAVPPGRDAGGDRAQPARRALAHERRARSWRRTWAGRPRSWACTSRAPSSTAPSEKEIKDYLVQANERGAGAQPAAAQHAASRARSRSSTA